SKRRRRAESVGEKDSRRPGSPAARPQPQERHRETRRKTARGSPGLRDPPARDRASRDHPWIRRTETPPSSPSDSDCQRLAHERQAQRRGPERRLRGSEAQSMRRTGAGQNRSLGDVSAPSERRSVRSPQIFALHPHPPTRKTCQQPFLAWRRPENPAWSLAEVTSCNSPPFLSSRGAVSTWMPKSRD